MNIDAFVTGWLEAWNAHDVDAVLAHFHDDVLFSSPVAAALLPESSGVVAGKPALRAYWTAALDKVPDLHFTLERVFQGVNIVVIQYRNQKNVVVNEVLVFEGDKVREGFGTYPSNVADPAGITTKAD
jgi:hypothetical protein